MNRINHTNNQGKHLGLAFESRRWVGRAPRFVIIFLMLGKFSPKVCRTTVGTFGYQRQGHHDATYQHRTVHSIKLSDTCWCNAHQPRMVLHFRLLQVLNDRTVWTIQTAFVIWVTCHRPLAASLARHSGDIGPFASGQTIKQWPKHDRSILLFLSYVRNMPHNPRMVRHPTLAECGKQF